MRSGMFAGIVYKGDITPSIGSGLAIPEMFFCFLAGFSESLVPSILSKSSDSKSANSKVGADKTDGDRVAADNATVNKAAADQAAADKAHDKLGEEK